MYLQDLKRLEHTADVYQSYASALYHSVRHVLLGPWHSHYVSVEAGTGETNLLSW